MKYINPDIFTNGSAEINDEPVGWVLLGTPTTTGDYPLSASADDRTAQLFTSDNKYYFKNYNIVGVSEVSSSAVALTHTTESTVNNLIITIDVGGGTRIFPDRFLDSVTSLSNGFDITNGILVLAKYKETTPITTLTNTISNFFTDTETLEHVSYQQQNATAELSTFYSTYIDKILLAYTVNWTGLISNYNFSGFAAGKVVLTLGDLNITD